MGDSFFESLDWSDLWEDAKMTEVIEYLKCNKHLDIPGHINLETITSHVSRP